MSSFPVSQTNSQKINIDFAKEAVYVSADAVSASNGASASTITSTNSVALGAWGYLNDSGETFIANSTKRIMILKPIPGRSLVVTNVNITADKEFSLILSIRPDLENGYNGATFNTNYTNNYKFYSKRQENVNGGSLQFDFEEPLIIRYGERLEGHIYKNTAEEIKYLMNRNAFSITNDFDTNLTKKFVVLGDSICGITNDAGARQDEIWTFRLKKLLANASKKYRHTNIGIGGTGSGDWDVRVRNGWVTGLEADAVFINIGMNDASASKLMITAGVDRQFKTTMKEIARNIRLSYSSGKIIFVGVTDTIDTGRNVVISGGYHNGLTLLQAVKAEQVELVSELNTEGVSVSFSDMTGLWDSSDGTYYVGGNASSDVHPSTKAQILMANKIFSDTSAIL